MEQDEKKSKKKMVIRIVILVVFLGLVALWFILSGETYKYDKLITGRQEAYDVINAAVSEGYGEIYFETTERPNSEYLDLLKIMKDAVADGSYAGCELYALRYEFSQGKTGYNVHVHLSDPSKFASFMTEWRVKQIASKFKDLSDYEKIKGVHDYIVLLNRYVAFEGGAYSTLYKGRSSCSGYAFSFYAIMRELGIPVTLEIGGNHAWNSVQLDGEWYNIDVTWDDNGVDEVSYAYFLKSDADFRGHHHGGATASVSAPVKGKSAEEYYDMVPNYMLIFEIIIIALFVLPVAILGFFLYKKRKKEVHVEKGQVMIAGTWSYLMPQQLGERYEIIRKFGNNPTKKDIWGLEDGKFFRESENEQENKKERVEVPPQVFFDELDFIITVSRGNNSRALCDALMDIRGRLQAEG